MKYKLDNADALNALPEAIRSEYAKQEDGSFILKMELPDGMEIGNGSGTAQLKVALNAERKKRAELEKIAEAYKGIDPEEAKDALAKRDEYDSKNIDKDKEFNRKLEAMRTQIVSAHETEKKTIVDKNTKMDKYLRKVLVDDAATNALAKAGVKNLKLITPHMRERLRVVEENGDYRVVTLDDNGDPAIDGTGMNPGMDWLVKQMVEQFPEAFPGTGRTGSGATGSTGNAGPSGTTMRRSEFDKLDDAGKKSFLIGADGKVKGAVID